MMSTYSVPFSRERGGTRVFTGIVTADISLDWLVDIVSRLSPYQSGFAFLISQSGVFVTHPDQGVDHAREHLQRGGSGR